MAANPTRSRRRDRIWERLIGSSSSLFSNSRLNRSQSFSVPSQQSTSHLIMNDTPARRMFQAFWDEVEREGDMQVFRLGDSDEDSGPAPAPDYVVEKLHRSKFKKLDTTEFQAEPVHDTCPICLDTFELEDTCLHLPCKHMFHESCAESWLKRRDSCPVCRAPTAPCDSSSSDDGTQSDLSTSSSYARLQDDLFAAVEDSTDGDGEWHDSDQSMEAVERLVRHAQRLRTEWSETYRAEQRMLRRREEASAVAMGCPGDPSAVFDMWDTADDDSEEELLDDEAVNVLGGLGDISSASEVRNQPESLLGRAVVWSFQSLFGYSEYRQQLQQGQGSIELRNSNWSVRIFWANSL